MKTNALACLLLLASASAAAAQRIPPPGLIPFPPPQIELSDTNASPMQVREMSVAASVRGLHATIETTLVFHNPNPRLLEGDLVFPLPDGAAVCGYALDIHGVLVEGVVVKKEKARVAFETETRRRVDPGLVEHVKGNLYRTRIYPLPANGTRTIRLTYTTPLAFAPNGDAALLLPMPRETHRQADRQNRGRGRRRARPRTRRSGRPPVRAGGKPLARGIRRHQRHPRRGHLGGPAQLAAARFTAIEQSPDGTLWFAVSALAPAAADKSGAPQNPCPLGRLRQPRRRRLDPGRSTRCSRPSRPIRVHADRLPRCPRTRAGTSRRRRNSSLQSRPPVRWRHRFRRPGPGHPG
jgi:hypothetical protein